MKIEKQSIIKIAEEILCDRKSSVFQMTSKDPLWLSNNLGP